MVEFVVIFHENLYNDDKLFWHFLWHGKKGDLSGMILQYFKNHISEANDFEKKIE